jgi:hypothetical protein
LRFAGRLFGGGNNHAIDNINSCHENNEQHGSWRRQTTTIAISRCSRTATATIIIIFLLFFADKTNFFINVKKENDSS